MVLEFRGTGNSGSEKECLKEWQGVKDRPETEPEEAEVKERDYREKNKT